MKNTNTNVNRRKRKNIKRKRRSQNRSLEILRLGLATLAVVLLLLFLFTGPVSRLFAKDASSVQAEQTLPDISYKLVEIRQGDSLWTIARDNMGPGYSDIKDYIKDIKECNQLESDNLLSGGYLMIPYYETGGEA